MKPLNIAPVVAFFSIAAVHGAFAQLDNRSTPRSELAIGVGLGLIASLALGRVIATQLWGVSPYDPWTLTCVPTLLIITGLLACWVPARRAASVDPLVALRYE